MTEGGEGIKRQEPTSPATLPKRGFGKKYPETGVR